MISRIYNGYVEHTRFDPVRHRLSYPIYFYCFDLDELVVLDKSIPLFGYNRYSLTSIYDRDYLDEGAGTIREKLLRHIYEAGLRQDISRIVIITSARYLSRVFNPVSFYYCFSSDNRVVCTSAEVNNTYGERHVYVMRPINGAQGGFPVLCSTEKAFHVSPFNEISGTYKMSFSEIAEAIEIHVDLYKSGKKTFSAVLQGSSMPLTARSLVSVILRHPFIPHLTIPRIYLEAAKLHLVRKLKMNDKPPPVNAMTIRKIPVTYTQKRHIELLRHALSHIEKGGIELVHPNGSKEAFGDTEDVYTARLMVNDNRFFPRLTKGVKDGLRGAYADRYWESDNLVRLLEILARNRHSMTVTGPVLSITMVLGAIVRHLTRRFYVPRKDSGIFEIEVEDNAFYSEFLDPSMNPTCALFLSNTDTLEQAQKNKMQRIIGLAGISSGHHVLEIGCGWGGFALEAAKTTGCTLTVITASRKQYEYTRQIVAESRLERHITILHGDYQRIRGTYDRIVSIEPHLEGSINIRGFFGTCDRLLGPEGCVVIQIITSHESPVRMHWPRNENIGGRILTNGRYPSLNMLCNSIKDHSSLIIEHMDSIGKHYPKTIQAWRSGFAHASNTLFKLGLTGKSQRGWLYDLSKHEAMFAVHALSVMHIVLRREGI